jgi:hypothetical protein
VAYSTVTRYLREAKLGTAEVALDREPSSPRLDDSDRAILAGASYPSDKTCFSCRADKIIFAADVQGTL